MRALTHPEVRAIVLGIMLAMFLGALDQTIVATALPTIGRHFGNLEDLSWVVTAYLLTGTAVTPLYGKLADIYGRKPVLLFGIAIFLIGSIACGAVPPGVAASMPLLVAFQAIPALQPNVPSQNPVLQGPLFGLHVSSLLFAYASFGLAFVIGITYVLLFKEIKAKHLGYFYTRLPSLQTLDVMNGRAIVVGWVLLTAGLIVGGVWASQIHGSTSDPRVHLALWLYATIDAVGSARELDRLSRGDLAYRWLRGGVPLDYHTLSDFRRNSGDLLDRQHASASRRPHRQVPTSRVAKEYDAPEIKIVSSGQRAQVVDALGDIEVRARPATTGLA